MHMSREGAAVLQGNKVTIRATELPEPNAVPFSHWRINGTDTDPDPTTQLR